MSLKRPFITNWKTPLPQSPPSPPPLFHIVNLELLVELFTDLKFDLNSSNRFRNSQFH